MRNNTNKKKQKFAGFCKQVLVPAFAGAVYAMSQMTVTAFAAGGVKCTHKTGHKVCVNHRKSQVIDSRFMGILNIRQ